jgi:hypothetical protein
MTILEDATLLTKKVTVTIVIYLVPITILVGGLLLTKHLLEGSGQSTGIQHTTKINLVKDK